MKLLLCLMVVMGVVVMVKRAEGSLPTTATLAWKTTKHGDLALLPLENAPYPHPSRANGFQGKAQSYPLQGHYDDPTVGFLLPAGFRPSREVDLIVHFHGHANHVEKEIKEFAFAEMAHAAGKNVALLFPQGPREALDSGCGKLEDPGGLKRLVEEALQALVATGKLPKGASVRHVVLSGHSGAYRGIAFCLRGGGLEDNIRAVWLWDATYGMLEDFAGWLARPRLDQKTIGSLLATPAPEPAPNRTSASEAGSAEASRPEPTRRDTTNRRRSDSSERQILSVFTAHLAEENAVLMAMLQKLEVPFGLWRDFDWSEAIRSPLQARFVTTTLEHNDVMSKREFFRQALEASEFLENTR